MLLYRFVLSLIYAPKSKERRDDYWELVDVVVDFCLFAFLFFSSPKKTSETKI